MTRNPDFYQESKVTERLTNVKQREWLIIKPDTETSLDDIYEAGLKVSSIVLAAEFSDGCVALVRKPYSKTDSCIPSGFKAFAPVNGKWSMDKGIATMLRFLTASTAFKTNINVEEKEQSDACMPLSEILAKMRDVLPKDFDTWTAAAKAARYNKHQKEPEKKSMYEGILVQKEELTRFFHSLSEVQPIVFRMNAKNTWAVNDKLWPDCTDAHDVKGWTWDIHKKKFIGMTLDEWVQEYHRNQSAILCGAGAAGKTQVMHSLGKTFCIMYGGDLYIYTKACDPVGILTKNGTTTQCSFFGFSDFNLETLMNSSLNAEEVKSLMDSQEGGSHRARQHAAIYPRKTPKCFAFNEDLVDMAKMFRGLGLPQFEHMFNKDAAKLSKMSNSDQATARRVAIFPIESQIVSKEQIAALVATDKEEAKKGQDRLKEWMRQHRG